MSLLEKLCKELGVNTKEIWMGNDDLYYYIDSSGKLYNVTYKDNLEECKCIKLDNISRILSGELKPVNKPIKEYSMLEESYNIFEWVDSHNTVVWHKHKGLIFKTRGEVIEMAEKILDFIKEKK